jgi:hypothetical protein
MTNDIITNDLKKRNVDRGIIKIRENRNIYSNNVHKSNDNKNEFCYKMYNDWIYTNNPVDIPVLIMDNENLLKNKDVDIIPRLYSKYSRKNMNIPFIYSEKKNKYLTLYKYFRNYIKKDIPNVTEFKDFLVNKKDLEKNQEVYVSINIFLYTSFLLKQFAPVMKIVPHFYSPISDETKYYFYILFDCLRRNCIKNEVPLMKKDVIELIRKIYSLHNKVLTNELFLNTFSFIDEFIFDNTNKFYLITLNKIFKFDLCNKDSDIENNSEDNLENNSKNISSETEDIDSEFINSKNKIRKNRIFKEFKYEDDSLFTNSFSLLRTP